MTDPGRMTIVEHLEELRRRLFRIVIAVVVCAVVAWILYDPILELLKNPFCDSVGEDRCRLIITDPLQGLSTRLTIAGYGGVALAMPVIMWQVWRFITPGLYDRERRWAIPFVASTVLLFCLGAGLAYWTLPRALDFLVSIGGDVEPLFTPDRYVTLIAYMMLAFGAGFQFPIVLIFLQAVGIVSTDRLRSWRRYALVGIVILVAVITPSGDPISLAALSVPMYLFYELSILVGRFIARRRARRDDG